ncbi:MAG: hypothetical protein M1129_05490 [Candidatus Thermoplasmatota archaeon]|jgi:hypothetical protein|nr:hypothetical protein [Candidatus Thermoplasmatota archaeon]
MSVTKEDVLGWLGGKDESSGNLVDIPWQIKKFENNLVLENEKVPFSIFLVFEQGFVRIFLKTGIETAVLENQERLGVYRVLLLLNRQLDLVKFMLDGMQEEVITRVDLELESLSKAELNDGMSMLLSSIYIMVKSLKLEDQFQQGITQRMLFMVQDMIKAGRSKEEIMKYLVEKIGLSKTESQNIVAQLVGNGEGKQNNGMYA